MSKPTVRNLPQAPRRTDLPSEFSSRADAFVASMQPWGEDVNNVASYVNDRADDAKDEADRSLSEANRSTSQANRSEQEADRSEQEANRSEQEADRAKEFKDTSETAAAAAQSAAGLPSLVGNGLNVLTVNSTEDGVSWEPGVQSLYTEFTESGVFTPDPRARWVYVECIAGGRGGRGGNAVQGAGNSNSVSSGQSDRVVPGRAVSRLFRSEDIPPSSVVIVGSGAQGGRGGHFKRNQEGIIINNQNGEAGGAEGNSSFISDNHLSTGNFPRTSGVDSGTITTASFNFVKGYGTMGGAGGNATSRVSSNSAEGFPGENGFADDAQKPVPQGGEGVVELVTSNNQTIDISASDGEDSNEMFVSGAGGGGVASSWGDGSPPDYTNPDITLRGGKGGKGGTASTGGSGGGAAMRIRFPPDQFSVELFGGDGGDGGDGIVKIWQW